MVGVLRVFGMIGVLRVFRMIGVRTLARRRLAGRFGFHDDAPARGDLRGPVSVPELAKRVDFIVPVHKCSSARRRLATGKVLAVERRWHVGDARAIRPRQLLRNLRME